MAINRRGYSRQLVFYLPLWQIIKIKLETRGAAPWTSHVARPQGCAYRATEWARASSALIGVHRAAPPFYAPIWRRKVVKMATATKQIEQGNCEPIDLFEGRKVEKCPECNRLIHMPCMACRAQRFRDIKLAEEEEAREISQRVAAKMVLRQLAPIPAPLTIPEDPQQVEATQEQEVDPSRMMLHEMVEVLNRLKELQARYKRIVKHCQLNDVFVIETTSARPVAAVHKLMNYAVEANRVVSDLVKPK